MPMSVPNRDENYMNLTNEFSRLAMNLPNLFQNSDYQSNCKRHFGGNENNLGVP